MDLLTAVVDLTFADLYTRRFDVRARDVDVPLASAAAQLTSLASVEKDIAAGARREELPRAEADRPKDQADITLLDLYTRHS